MLRAREKRSSLSNIRIYEGITVRLIRGAYYSLRRRPVGRPTTKAGSHRILRGCPSYEFNGVLTREQRYSRATIVRLNRVNVNGGGPLLYEPRRRNPEEEVLESRVNARERVASGSARPAVATSERVALPRLLAEIIINERERERDVSRSSVINKRASKIENCKLDRDRVSRSRTRSVFNIRVRGG